MNTFWRVYVKQMGVIYKEFSDLRGKWFEKNINFNRKYHANITPLGAMDTPESINA